jgi:hypothetical protein
MMRAVLALVLFAWPVWAEAPDTSPRPAIRPQGDAALSEPDQPEATVVRPMPRPAASPTPDAPAAADTAAAEAAQVAVTAALQPAPAPPSLILASSPRPQPRPKAAPVAKAPAEDGPPLRTSGYVCGDPDIVGVQLADIHSRTQGCGVDDPVQVTMVDGVALSQASTMDCPTALALKRWINEGVRPVFANDPVVRFQVAAHYICRTRNNIRGAKISEHGRGKAIDIAAFVLASGRVLTVAANYGKQIRAVHKAACGIFGTTLGPGSDGYHEDHIHLDTAHYNNGPYCR